MLGKICVIASVKLGSKTLCSPLVGGKTINHNQLKNSWSAERVYNLKKYVRCGVLKTIGLHIITPCYRQLMRSSRMEIAVLPERQALWVSYCNRRWTVNSSKKTWQPRSNDDHNIELYEQSPDHRKNSKFQSFCPNKTTRQYHKQHAKHSTDLRVTLTGPLDLQCQNELTGRSKSSIILMQET